MLQIQTLNSGSSKDKMSEETLYASASSPWLLLKKVFASIIGHELGHFRGYDTFYIMRFSTVYVGLLIMSEIFCLNLMKASNQLRRDSIF
ncbi:TPA: hypothetical protein JBK25_15625 [Legionella pneumophila]|nr:hypothetical protein [Legionella pneumophila]